jgi:hypothetical protein
MSFEESKEKVSDLLKKKNWRKKRCPMSRKKCMGEECMKFQPPVVSVEILSAISRYAPQLPVYYAIDYKCLLFK